MKQSSSSLEWGEMTHPHTSEATDPHWPWLIQTWLIQTANGWFNQNVLIICCVCPCLSVLIGTCVFYKYSQQEGTKTKHVYHSAQHLLAEDHMKHGCMEKKNMIKSKITYPHPSISLLVSVQYVCPRELQNSQERSESATTRIRMTHKCGLNEPRIR